MTWSRIVLMLVMALLALTVPASATELPRGSADTAVLAATTADAQNVALIGHIGGGSFAIAVQGNYAYIGLGPELAIVDISDPASSHRVGYIVLSGRLEDIAVMGNYAYVAGEDGLQVVDISNPVNPIKAGFYGSGCHKVVLADSYAYATCGAGLRVLDISEPTDPIEVGFYDPPLGDPLTVAVSNNYAYVVESYPSGWYMTDYLLRVVDITNPANPTEVGFYDAAGDMWKITVAGSYAYVVDGGLQVLDISEPTNPTFVGHYNVPPRCVRDVEVVGSYAYVACERDGLRVVDVSDPTSPSEVGSRDTLGFALDVAVAGDYVYVNDYDWGGLWVMDVSDPADPDIVGSYTTLVGARRVAVADDHAYAASFAGSFHVVDVSDPTNPDVIGFYGTPGEAFDVAVAGDYAYVADGFEGLRVVDVTNPANPTEVGFYNTPGEAREMTVVVTGGYAYLTGEYYVGLRVVDISDPTNPTEVGFYDAGDTGEIAVVGNYLYAVDGSLQVLDISDPTTPTVVGTCSTRGDASRIAVAEGYAYIACADGLQVVDISDPTAPTEVGFYATLESAYSLAVAGNYAYLGLLNRPSLYVVDISNPATLAEMGYYTLPNPEFWPDGITVADNYVYSYNKNRDGLFILQFGSTLSGRIVDRRYAPFAGITFPVDTDLNIATDANGVYTVTNLLYGTYTLTPTLTGYTFWPLTRTITMPPDALNQNFVILAETVSTTLMSGISSALVYTDTYGLVTQLGVPDDAVIDPTTLVLTPILVPGGAGFAFAGHAFELSVYQEGSLQPGFTFSAPVTVTIDYSSADVRVVTDESQLALRWWAGDQWRDATETCLPNSSYSRDLDGNVLSVPICQVGRFGLLGPTHSGYLPLVFRDGP